MSTVPIVAMTSSPAPAAMPIAATDQRLAAVVSPRTCPRYWRITPAPRKPMPVTIWAATRVGSAPAPVESVGAHDGEQCRPQRDQAVRPEARRLLRWSSRSKPTIAPRTSANARGAA